jgi:hypothetical protein
VKDRLSNLQRTRAPTSPLFASAVPAPSAAAVAAVFMSRWWNQHDIRGDDPAQRSTAAYDEYGASAGGRYGSAGRAQQQQQTAVPAANTQYQSYQQASAPAGYQQQGAYPAAAATGGYAAAATGGYPAAAATGGYQQSVPAGYQQSGSYGQQGVYQQAAVAAEDPYQSATAAVSAGSDCLQ